MLPPDNTFALPTEVFSSCLAVISAVTVGGLFLWPALRYGTCYQTVWKTRPSAETLSDIRWRRFYFQLTCVHSTLELSGQCALQIYLLTYLLLSDNNDVSYSIALNCASLVKLFFLNFHPVTSDGTDQYDIFKYIDTSCFAYGANNWLHFFCGSCSVADVLGHILVLAVVF